VTKLTHRVEIYQFPTPFMRGDYRVQGSSPPDPAGTDYVLVDTTAFSVEAKHDALFAALIEPGSGFEVAYDHDDIVLLRRTGEPVSDFVRSFAPIGR